MTNETKLEPCRWCGAEVPLVPEFVNGDRAVECAHCGARGPIHPTLADAIAAWNRGGAADDARTLTRLEAFLEIKDGVIDRIAYVSKPRGTASVTVFHGLHVRADSGHDSSLAAAINAALDGAGVPPGLQAETTTGGTEGRAANPERVGSACLSSRLAAPQELKASEPVLKPGPVVASAPPPTIGGIPMIADETVPENEVQVHYADGRIERFEVDQFIRMRNAARVLTEAGVRHEEQAKAAARELLRNALTSSEALAAPVQEGETEKLRKLLALAESHLRDWLTYRSTTGADTAELERDLDSIEDAVVAGARVHAQGEERGVRTYEDGVRAAMRVVANVKHAADAELDAEMNAHDEDAVPSELEKHYTSRCGALVDVWCALDGAAERAGIDTGDIHRRASADRVPLPPVPVQASVPRPSPAPSGRPASGESALEHVIAMASSGVEIPFGLLERAERELSRLRAPTAGQETT